MPGSLPIEFKKNRIRSYEDVYGLLGEDDIEFLEETCRKIKSGVIVELGIFLGKSLAVMGPIAKKNNTKIFSVDNFSGVGSPQLILAHKNGQIKPWLDELVQDLRLQATAFIVEDDSAAAALRFPDGIIDFCFIDADHKEEAVREDIIAWWPKIRLGGILGGHDYDEPTEDNGVRKVVNDFVHEKGLSLNLVRNKSTSTLHSSSWWVVKDKL